MQPKEHSISINKKHRAEAKLNTQDAKHRQEKHQLQSNLTPFTNQVILTSLNHQQKSQKLKRISCKRSSYQKNIFFCEFLKINSLISTQAKDQDCVEKQKNSIISKSNQTIKANNSDKRPKSAFTKASPFTEIIQPTKQQPKNQNQTLENDMILTPLPKQDINLTKQNLMKGKFKNKNPNKITLFTNNPNVFIPRKSNKHYCSYLSKSKINEFSYKTNQQLLKISRSDRSIKRNTVSIINQRQLHQKCKQMLNNKNDINPSSNVSNRNIKRKKIDFSKSHSQLFKTANTQCSQSALKNQHIQVVNLRSRNSASEHLYPEYHQNLMTKYKIVQIHKKIQEQFKNTKILKQKSINRSCKKEVQANKIEMKNTQPSLYIQQVQLGVQGSKKQKEYYRVTCPENIAHKNLDLFNTFYEPFTQKNKNETQVQLHQKYNQSTLM